MKTIWHSAIKVLDSKNPHGHYMGGYENELQETDSRHPKDLTSNISRLLGFATKNPESLREFLRIVEIVRSFLILKEYSTLIS